MAADRDRGRPSGQRTPSHRPGAEWRGRARRWAWLAVLLIGVALYELCRRAVLATRDPLLLPTLILIGAAVVPVSFVVFVSGRRLVFGVGGAVVGLTALLGGVLAVLATGTLEYATLRALGAPSLLAVGLIEELAKLLVPAAVLLLSRGVRHPADGLAIVVVMQEVSIRTWVAGATVPVPTLTDGSAAESEKVAFAAGAPVPRTGTASAATTTRARVLQRPRGAAAARRARGPDRGNAVMASSPWGIGSSSLGSAGGAGAGAAAHRGSSCVGPGSG